MHFLFLFLFILNETRFSINSTLHLQRFLWLHQQTQSVHVTRFYALSRKFYFAKFNDRFIGKLGQYPVISFLLHKFVLFAEIKFSALRQS